MSPVQEAVSSTGTFVICTKQNTPKQPSAKYMHKKKNENHKIIRKQYKRNRSIFKKKRRILYVLYMPPFAIMHNVTRSYRIRKGEVFQR